MGKRNIEGSDVFRDDKMIFRIVKRRYTMTGKVLDLLWEFFAIFVVAETILYIWEKRF